MFKTILILCISLLVTCLFAQAQMNVHTTSGTSTFNLNEIIEITFSQENVPSQMALVQGGTFNNGVSEVTVSSFYMDKFEITQASYQAVMQANPSSFPGVYNGPVETVTWFDAIEYCNKLSIAQELTPCYSYMTYGTNPDSWPTSWSNNHMGVSCNWIANGYRLPTEAEWQFAARGGNQTHNYIYSGSNNVQTVAWYGDNSGATTHAVGSKDENEFAIHDMSGNVWEWVWDIYGDYPNETPANPHGAVSGQYRVARGGSWYNYDYWCTVSTRNYGYPHNTDHLIGFRICKNAQ